MNSEIFLSCFLASLFAFVVLGLIAWQIGSYFAMRWFKRHFAEILKAAAGADVDPSVPTDDPIVEELMRAARAAPPGVIAHLPVVTCRCGVKQDVPADQNLQPYLMLRGWRCEERFDGWACPSCVAKP